MNKVSWEGQEKKNLPMTWEVKSLWMKLHLTWVFKNDSESFLRMTQSHSYKWLDKVMEMPWQRRGKNVLKEKTRPQWPKCIVKVKSLGIAGVGLLKRLVRLRSQRIFWFTWNFLDLFLQASSFQLMFLCSTYDRWYLQYKIQCRGQSQVIVIPCTLSMLVLYHVT